MIWLCQKSNFYMDIFCAYSRPSFEFIRFDGITFKLLSAPPQCIQTFMHFLVILDCPKSAHRNRSRNHGPSTCDLISHERNATQKTDKLYACSRAEPTNTDCWIDILHRAMAVRVRAFCFDRTHSNIDWFSDKTTLRSNFHCMCVVFTTNWISVTKYSLMDRWMEGWMGSYYVQYIRRGQYMVIWQHWWPHKNEKTRQA